MRTLVNYLRSLLGVGNCAQGYLSAVKKLAHEVYLKAVSSALEAREGPQKLVIPSYLE